MRTTAICASVLLLLLAGLSALLSKSSPETRQPQGITAVSSERTRDPLVEVPAPAKPLRMELAKADAEASVETSPVVAERSSVSESQEQDPAQAFKVKYGGSSRDQFLRYYKDVRGMYNEQVRFYADRALAAGVNP